MSAQDGQEEQNPNIFISPTFQKIGANSLLPYLFNPQNIKFLKGEQPYIANEIGALVRIGVCLLLLLTLGAIWISFMTFENWQLDHQGIQTQALVTNKYIEDSRNWLEYTFNLPTNQSKTTPHSSLQIVDQDTYNASELNASITIIYVPDNPDNTDVVGDTLRQILIVWIFIFLAYLLLTLYILALIYQRRGMYIRLAQTGVLLWGKVTKSTPIKLYGIPVVEIKYEFMNPKGHWLKKKFVSYLAGSSRKRMLPSLGANILVIYVDDKNHTIL
jgi:hypothetical protein